MGMMAPASTLVSRGVMTEAASVEAVVIRTDSATSPYATNVATLDAYSRQEHAVAVRAGHGLCWELVPTTRAPTASAFLILGHSLSHPGP